MIILKVSEHNLVPGRKAQMIRFLHTFYLLHVLSLLINFTSLSK